jgi:hypothetical protein
MVRFSEFLAEPGKTSLSHIFSLAYNNTVEKLTALRQTNILGIPSFILGLVRSVISIH